MAEIRRTIRRLSCTAAALVLVGWAAPGSWAQAKTTGSSSSHALQSSSQVNQSSSHAHQIYTSPQPPSKADFTGHGANTHGPYDSTRSGAPALNGNGGGVALGKPCAACVGKADNKNPAGQLPGGSDPNAGYECDRNHGIGRTNPAHTACGLTVTTSPATPPSSSPAPSPSSAGVAGVSAPRSGAVAGQQPGSTGGLASTGASVGKAILAAIVLVSTGVALTLLARIRRRAEHAQ